MSCSRTSRRLIVIIFSFAFCLFGGPALAITLYGSAHSGSGSGASTLYQLNGGNGSATTIGPIGFNRVGGMDFQPVTGTLFAVGKDPGNGDNVLITIDIDTGVGTLVGTLQNVTTATNGGLFDLSFRNGDGTLFLTALSDPFVFLYTVDPATGVATAVGTSGQTGAGNALGFSIGDTLRLASSSGLFVLDQSSGAATAGPAISFSGFPGGGGGERLTAMDHRPQNDGNFVAVNAGTGGSGPNYLGVLNVGNGVVSHRGLTVSGLDALAWLPDPPVETQGKLFGVSHPGGPTAPSTLYRIDPANGSSLPIGPVGFNAVGGIDFHPQTRVLFGVGKRPADDVDVLITINPLTGEGTEIGPLVNTNPAGAGGLFGLSWRADGVLFLSAILANGNVGLFSVDEATGLATNVGDTLAAGSGNGIGFADSGTLFLSSGTVLSTVDEITASVTTSANEIHLGFPALADPRLTAIDFNPITGVPVAAVYDGSMGQGPTYLGFFDRTTGTIVYLGPTVGGLTGLAWRPDRDPCGVTIYGTAQTGSANSPSTFYEIDPLTGAAAIVGAVGFDGVGGMALDPFTRTLYAMARRPADGINVLITIDPKTGAGTEIGPLLNTGNFNGGHFDLAARHSDGQLYLAAHDDVPMKSIFTVNKVSGEATFLGQTGTSSTGNALGFSLIDTLFYADNENGGTLRTVDQMTGVASSLSSLTYVGFPTLSIPRPSALGFDPSSAAAYLAINDGSFGNGPHYLGLLDPTTGVVNFIGRSVDGLDSIAVSGGCEDLVDCTIDTCDSCTSELFGAAHSGGPTGNSILYRIDPSSGSETLIGPVRFDDVGGLDFHPVSGVLYGVGKRGGNGEDVALIVDPVSGAGTAIGALLNTDDQGVGGHFDVAFRDSDATLFLTAYDDVSNVTLYTIDLTSGEATAVGATATVGTDQALGFSGGHLYHADDTLTGTLYTLDQAFGNAAIADSLTYVGFPQLTAPRPNALAFDPCSPVAAISIDDGSNGSGPNYLGLLDAGSGVVTFVGAAVNGLDALAARQVVMTECLNTLSSDPDGDGVCDTIDNCPQVANPLQDAVFFADTLLAISKTRYGWSTPQDVRLVEGDVSGLASYAISSTSSAQGATFFLAPGDGTPGQPRYFMLRVDCSAGSWSSTGSGECATPAVCPVGERDGNLP